MKLGIAVAGPILLPHTAATRELEGTAMYSKWQYRIDMAKTQSRMIPCAMYVEVYARDHVVMAAIGRQLIPELERRDIDLPTWGDLFQFGSTIRFLEDRLLGILDRMETEGGTTYLKLMNKNSVYGNFRATTLEAVPDRLLRRARIGPGQSAANVKIRLRPVLETLADDPFFIPT